MGATDFTALSQHPDAETAFSAAIRDAQFDHGHGGYSGTIAEKSSYTILHNKPRSRAAAYRFAQDIMEDYDNRHVANDKWGPAAAIPVCTTAKDEEREVSLKVQADPEKKFQREDLERILRAEGVAKEGDVIQRARVSFDDRTRVQARRTKGDIVTRYFYEAPPAFHPPSTKGDQRNWLSGFTSMAEWRKHAEVLAKERGGRYGCIGISRRFDTEPLDVVEAVVTKRTATIEATIITPQTSDLKTDAWLFFGLASC